MKRLFKNTLVYIVICLSVLLSLVGGVFAMGESSVEWMSHADFTALETDKAWANPEYYLGYSAQFNSIEYSNYRIGNIVDGSFVEYTDNDNIVSLSDNTKARNIGQYYKVKLVDYYQDENDLWYKVEALDGYVLPQEMVDNPYLLYLDNYKIGGWSAAPTLHMLPRKAMLRNDVLTIKNNPVGASHFVEVNKEYIPDFFDVTYINNETWYGYDLGDVTAWNQDIISSEYRYVDEGSVILIPADVTIAYEKLLETETYEEYNEILSTIPSDVLEQFTPSHMEHIEEQEEELKGDVIVDLEKTITIDGKEIPVYVSGNILGDYELSVEHVSNQTVLDEGFDIDNVEDIITALDIKVVDAEGNEWQPTNGKSIMVSIGVSELGIEDGRTVRLHHKHKDEIYVFDEVMVMDGQITVYTSGFSIYVVENIGDTTWGRDLHQQTEQLEIGETYRFYCLPDNNNRTGTWEVLDTSGAIYYTVHTQTQSNAIGNGGTYAPWIEVVCLKETSDSNRVRLTYRHSNGNNNGYNNGNTNYVVLEINPPSNPSGTRELYIADDVNRTGRIIASLSDGNGKDISEQLAGASFKWTREDDINGNKLLITPRAYGDNSYENDGSGVANSSINIAMDHAGLVEARKNGNEYALVTYTVKAILSDGSELEANYTVYYQSEIINADFEFPEAKERDYTFFANGMEGLYWKTTAPGATSSNSSTNNLTKDIEIAEVTNFFTPGGAGDGRRPNDQNAGTQFGVPRAADYDSGGTQFAELNAQAFGALYQDVISVPGEDLEWEFSHAPRRDLTNDNGGWATKISNAMYIIVGATENAQKLTTQAHLDALGKAAKDIAGVKSDTNTFYTGKTSVIVKNFTYNNINYGDYEVWYHDATTIPYENDYDYTINALYQADAVYGKNNNYGWTELSGSYHTPDNQYRTRLFFVSDSSQSGSGTLNAGNLIDAATAGIYKSYLIEYYEESFDNTNNQKIVKHLSQYDQKDIALIYSSVKLTGLDQAVNETKDYLHRILINGSSYPYETRTEDFNDATIYIEKYPGQAEYVVVGGAEDHTNDYSEYDIVVQIFVRDTVISIEKQIGWPKNGEEETLTIEQKLDIIEQLNQSKDGGYLTEFKIEDTIKMYEDELDILIQSRTPEGNYLGYSSPDTNPALDRSYIVTETYATPIPGLELDKVTLNVVRYRYGVGSGFEADGDGSTNNVTYTIGENGDLYKEGNFVDENGNPLSTGKIYLSNVYEHNINQPGYKIAEITVINEYKEKNTTIHYKAVGNGKVAFVGDAVPDYADTPTEELPYYSGKAKGAAVHPGKDAVFIGWFKDEACTQEVEDVDGVWDRNDNSFKPNANILNADEVTFYAKFETSYITIKRENGQPGQIYLYQVHVDVPYPNKDYDIYVSLACGDDGKGEVDILELGDGTYTVTELKDYSWRYNEVDSTFVQEETMPKPVDGKAPSLTFVFTGERSNSSWVNEYADKKNVYQGAK